MNTIEYWEDREEKRRTVEKMSDAEVKLRTQAIISGHFGRMIETVESFYQRYAVDEGITINEAKKRVTKLDIERYEALAAYYVKNRDDKDIAFSKEANEQMKLYNVTMKINREKLLMAEIYEHMKNMGGELEYEMRNYLDKSTKRELKRQAGMLGNINISQNQFNALINSTHLSDKKIWSERLWTNIALVQKEVDKAIHDSLIRGIHPQKAVKRLRELTGRSDYEARRLLFTEVTRAQSEAQLLSLTEKKIKKFRFFAHLDERTTLLCENTHKKVFDLSEAKIGLNVPPLHQFCRSSIAPEIDVDDIVDEGGGVFNIFNDDDDEFNDEPEDDDITSGDESDDLLDELDGLLDEIEAKQGKQKVKPETKKKIEKIIEDVPEELDPYEPDMNVMIRNFLNDEQYEGVYNQLKNAQDPRAIKLFNDNTQDVGLKTKANGAHYWVVDNSVTMEMSQYGYGVHGNHESEYSRTFFHEYGHAIDAEFIRRRGDGSGRIDPRSFSLSQTYKGSNDKTLEQTMKDEWKAYEKAVQKKESAELFELIGEKLNISETRNHIKKEITKNDEYLWQDLSDMIEGATGGKLQLGWGHGKAYWQRNDGALSMEIFAELYSLMVTSLEAYNFTKEYVPETVAIFEEMIKYMLDEEE